MTIKKRTVRLMHTTLGEGMPKVCIPVMGTSMAEIRVSAEKAREAQADIIELRMDSYASSPSGNEAIEACRAVRAAAPETALIFTQRTVRDGGAGTDDAAAYEQLLDAVCSSRAADAIDCELSVGEEIFSRIVRKAHEMGTAVIGSSHEFGCIGRMEKAGTWLTEQERLGADICKAAVMTYSKAEAFEAAYVMTKAEETMSAPMIGIAMGPAGILTRVGAQCMGSCLTFGAAGTASAPGQMDAKELRRLLESIHRAMNE